MNNLETFENIQRRITNLTVRTFFILISLLFSCGCSAQKDDSSQNNDFKHDWNIEYLEHEILFTSKKTTPMPFSQTDEPQATMYFAAFELDAKSEKKLQKIVEEEIIGIRKEIRIAEYLEEDHRAKENIAVYFEKYKKTQLAVIKYRTNGEIQGDKTVSTRSIKQILFIFNNKLYISTLIVLYAEYQDDIRCDQMTFIKAIIDKSK